MTASETEGMEHGSEAAAPDFEQTFAGMASADFRGRQSRRLFGHHARCCAKMRRQCGEPHVEADNSAMIAGLPVMMKVVLGSAKMPVATLAKLAKGSVVKLDKMVGDPVDILVNGRLIARGEVVVLNEASSRFGVVLTQVGKLAPSAKVAGTDACMRDTLPNAIGPSRPLTGAEKVGVLLLALGKERASGLLKKFNPEELNIIVRSTEVMPTISASELEGIVEEFESQLGLGTPFVGRPEDVKRLVTDVITENKSSLDANDQFVAHQDIWTRLAALQDDVLQAISAASRRRS